MKTFWKYEGNMDIYLINHKIMFCRFRTKLNYAVSLMQNKYRKRINILKHISLKKSTKSGEI